MDSIARLGIEIDSSGAVAGAANLDKLAAGGQRAEQAVRSFAGAAQTAAAAQVAAARAALEQANALGQAGAAEQRAAAQALALARANQTQAAAAVAATRATVAQAQAARLAGDASIKAAGGATEFAGRAQNASFQLADFATQIASGQSATVALAQQLPQLLGGFGLLGAAAGAAVAVVGALATTFLTTSDNSDTAAGSLDRASSAFDAGADAASRYAQQLKGATAEQRLFLQALGERQTAEALTKAQGIIGRASTEAQATISARAEAAGAPTADTAALTAEFGGAAARQEVLTTVRANLEGDLAAAVKAGDADAVARIGREAGIGGTGVIGELIATAGEVAANKALAEGNEAKLAAQAATGSSERNNASAGRTGGSAPRRTGQDQLAELEERARLVGDERAQAVAAARRSAPEGTSATELDAIGEAAGRLFDLERANQAAAAAIREREQATTQAATAAARDAEANQQVLDSLARTSLTAGRSPREQSVESAVARLRNPTEQQIALVRELAGRNFDEAESQRARAEALREVEALAERALSPQQQLAETSAQIEALYAAEAISLEQRNAALARAGEIAQRETAGTNERAERERRSTDAVFDVGRGFEEEAADRLDLVRNGADLTSQAFDDLNASASQFILTGKGGFTELTELATSFADRLLQIGLNAAVFGPLEAALGGALAGSGGGAGAGAGAGGGGAGGGLFGLFGGLFGGAQAHTGGTIGVNLQPRAVDPMWFMSAPRLHGGGPILRPDEVPIIGLRGERVLNRQETAAFERGERGDPRLPPISVAIDARGATNPGMVAALSRQQAKIAVAEALSVAQRDPKKRRRLTGGP